MKQIVVVIFVLFLYIPAFGQHPYVQPIKKLAVITFPDTPKMEDTTGDIVYSRTVNYNYYLTQVTYLKQSFRDLMNASSNDSVYANFIRSTLKANGGKLIYKAKITLQGVNGLEYAYTAIRDSDKEYRYRQIFYFNNTLILNGVTSSDSLKSNDKILDNFFKTFKISIHGNQILQGGSVSPGKSIGYAFGTLLAIALIIAMIAGIIAIIKKRLVNKDIP